MRAKWNHLFTKKLPPGLPPHRRTNHRIDLIAGAQPKSRQAYPLAEEHRKAVQEEIEALLARGHIRPSISPWGAPLLVVRQGEKLRLVYDYRDLNAVTVRNAYPMPTTDEIVKLAAGKKIFAAIDCASAFNQVRMEEGHEYLTAFNCHLGHFEWRVLSFGLCNAPSQMQATLDDVLGHLRELGVAW